MRNSKQLLFLTFLSLIICSYARLNIISSSPSASPSPSQLPVGSDANHISISPSLHVDTPYSSPPAPLEYVWDSPAPSQGNLESISLSPNQGNLGNVSPSPSQVPKLKKVSPSPSQAPKSQKVSPSPSQTLGDVSSSPNQAPVGSNSPHISISPSLPPKAALTPSTSPIAIDGQSHKWCGKTDNPDLCVEMISSSLKDNSDLNGAVNVAIKQTADTAKAGMEKISKLPQVESEPMFQDYLESVKDSLDDFENAQDALTQKDWGTLNTMLSGAMTNFGDEALPQSPDVPEITQFNERLNKMTSNCLALSALLDPNANY